MTSIRHKDSAPDTSAATAPDDAYLDAARAAILAVGWSRTTLTDIARRAGVSRMTLYRRWPDMQTMLADLLTREWGQVLAGVMDLDAQAGTAGREPFPALDRIRQGVVATVRALRANELLLRVTELDPELLLPYLLDRRGRSQELLAGVLAELIRQGQSDGSVRTGDADLLARSLLLACQGFALSAHTMVDTPQGRRDADLSHLDSELAHLVERFLTT